MPSMEARACGTSPRPPSKRAKEAGFRLFLLLLQSYAGQIYPETATDAFCALHKGLDAADTKAYPEAEFGEATPDNIG